MTKALAVLAAVAFGLSLSMSAGAADKTLAEIHGSAWPKSVNGYVVKEQCKACHGDYSKLAKMTENLDPNPHHSHLGDVNCTDCLFCRWYRHQRYPHERRYLLLRNICI